MAEHATARCCDCMQDFSYAPEEHMVSTAKGLILVPPRRCPACTEKRRLEDEQLLAAALQDRALAHAYRCRGCRRLFLLLRPWTRAGGLLFCPDCRPAYFQKNPLDARLNKQHGYPRF